MLNVEGMIVFHSEGYSGSFLQEHWMIGYTEAMSLQVGQMTDLQCSISEASTVRIGGVSVVVQIAWHHTILQSQAHLDDSCIHVSEA